GFAARISATVHSGLSLSGRVVFLRIGFLLSSVRAPQTDNPNPLPARRNHRNMQSAVYKTNDSHSPLAVISASVVDCDRGIKVEIRETLERHAPEFDIRCVLRIIELKHDYIVYTICRYYFPAASRYTRAPRASDHTGASRASATAATPAAMP